MAVSVAVTVAVAVSITVTAPEPQPTHSWLPSGFSASSSGSSQTGMACVTALVPASIT
ncbi:hypothetical protein ACFQ9X_34000 [Catenulispora yoronensis]